MASFDQVKPRCEALRKMLAESAVCLAQDDLSSQGGMLTPAAAMGEALILRLQKNAGLDFSIEA